MFQKKGTEDIKNSITEYIDSKIKRNRNWKYFYLLINILLFTVMILDLKTSLDIPKFIIVFIILGGIVSVVLALIFVLKELFYRVMKINYQKYFLDKNKSKIKSGSL
jgi:hypothetical protein